MTLPREVLAAPISNFRYASPSRRRTPSPPAPDANAIDEAAGMIASADNPIIVTNSCGREEADVAKLAALAETVRDSGGAAQGPLYVPAFRSPDESWRTCRGCFSTMPTLSSCSIAMCPGSQSARRRATIAGSFTPAPIRFSAIIHCADSNAILPLRGCPAPRSPRWPKRCGAGRMRMAARVDARRKRVAQMRQKQQDALAASTGNARATATASARAGSITASAR